MVARRRRAHRLCGPISSKRLADLLMQARLLAPPWTRELKRFYYDTAQVANNVTLAAMAQLMPISQIVYGTDFPYRTAADDTKGVTEFFKGDELEGRRPRKCDPADPPVKDYLIPFGCK